MSTVVATNDNRTIEARFFSRFLDRFGVYFIAIILLGLGLLLQAITAAFFLPDPKRYEPPYPAVLVACGHSANAKGLEVYQRGAALMALSGIVAVEFLRFGFIPAMLAALLVGLLVGVINGIAIGKFKANPIIWTLAMSYVTMGMIRFIWVNRQIYPDVITSNERAVTLFDNIYRFRLFDVIGMPVILLLIVVVVGQFILVRTRFGAQLKLTGSARRVARFTGIKVERIIGTAFIISAVCAVVGGLAVTSLSRVGAWYNGAGYDFRAVTAVVLGGMTLAGGRGTVVGVLGGTLVIGLMNNIMTLLGIGTFSQDMIRGLVFIIVVAINAQSLRSMGRDDA